MMQANTKLALLATALVLGIWGICIACQVPVFRYALERWATDMYSLHIIPENSSGELSDRETGVLNYFNEAKANPDFPPNFSIEVIPREAGETGPSEIEIFYPRKRRGGPFQRIWKGPLSDENAKKVIRSPSRAELVKRIQAGDSVVWVFMPGGNEETTRKARETLETTLKKGMEIITIPDGVVTDTQVDTSGFSGDPDDVVSSGVPLKIAFSVLEISRDDPAEEIFLTMFLNLEDDLYDFAESPMVFPVFGRGRVLEPLIDRGINPDTILEYCGYLCGACSCEVKDQNPGMDLLVSANWDGAIEGSTAFIEKVLPPLEGPAVLAATELQEGTTPAIARIDPNDMGGGSPFRTWGIVIGTALLALAVGSQLLKRRSSQ